uniref:Carbonyl reductase 1 n=1 Tax=Poecilia latipinna TaxID=48699 RepID=A0A3B3U815_9TELE
SHTLCRLKGDKLVPFRFQLVIHFSIFVLGTKWEKNPISDFDFINEKTSLFSFSHFSFKTKKTKLPENTRTYKSSLHSLIGRVVNVSSFVGPHTLNKCSLELQQRFRSDDITEDELVGLMQRFVDKAKKGEHKQDGWPEMPYGVSKLGLTTLSMILARRLSKDRPNDGILLNACCPGWVRTDMAGERAAKSPDEGAVTLAYLALLPPETMEPHGKFVSDKKVQPW